MQPCVCRDYAIYCINLTIHPRVCGEPAHSGQVDSDGDMEEDEEEATAKGTLRTNALLDGLVECLGVGNLHLTGKLGEWETERATLPCGTAEPVGSLTVLGAGKKDKASLLPPSGRATPCALPVF